MLEPMRVAHLLQEEPVSGTYHINGDLLVQPVEALEAAFNDCKPIFEACAWDHQSRPPLSSAALHHGWMLCRSWERAWYRLSLLHHLLLGEEEEAAEVSRHDQRAPYMTGYQLWLLAGPTKRPSADILGLNMGRLGPGPSLYPWRRTGTSWQSWWPCRPQHVRPVKYTKGGYWETPPCSSGCPSATAGTTPATRLQREVFSGFPGDTSPKPIGSLSHAFAVFSRVHGTFSHFF
jgi:hypothetical protein